MPQRTKEKTAHGGTCSFVDPYTLPPAQLAHALNRIRGILYRDEQGVMDLQDGGLGGADAVSEIGEVLNDLGMVPRLELEELA